MRKGKVIGQASTTLSLTTLGVTTQGQTSQPERSRRLTCCRWVFLLLFTAACTNEQKSTDKLFNFDGLIDDQISQLSQRARVVDKTSELDGEKSDSTFLPSLKGWGDELEVFRQLEMINKPAYRSVYKLDDPLKDNRSNLSIRRYESPASPIPVVRFYYQENFARLRKIEALLTESNILYTTHRELTLEFEEEDNKPILSRYSLSGFQKIPFTDTVRFSVTAQIEW